MTVQASPPASSAATPAAGTASLPAPTRSARTSSPAHYRTSGSGCCYWARLSSNDGEFDSIIANGFDDGPSSMSIKSSDEYDRVLRELHLDEALTAASCVIF